MADYIIAIPSRRASTRLPNKPLLDICGIPMVKRVAMQALKTKASRVIVCIDDEKTKKALEGCDAEVCMTSVDAKSGTDRIAQMIELLNIDPETIIVNIQGDEPLVNVKHIEQVAKVLEDHKDASMGTLCFEIDNVKDFLDPNCVKVVMDKDGYALYFSRATISYERDNFKNGNITSLQFPHYHHMGIYSYRAKDVLRFNKLSQPKIESSESLEQLRVLYNGEKIAVGICQDPPLTGVDTMEDYQRICAYIKEHGDNL